MDDWDRRACGAGKGEGILRWAPRGAVVAPLRALSCHYIKSCPSEFLKHTSVHFVAPASCCTTRILWLSVWKVSFLKFVGRNVMGTQHEVILDCLVTEPKRTKMKFVTNNLN
jgi:hypothetical protein